MGFDAPSQRVLGDNAGWRDGSLILLMFLAQGVAFVANPTSFAIWTQLGSLGRLMHNLPSPIDGVAGGYPQR